jgi:hypothetical protein
VREEVDQVGVLEEERAVLTDALRLVGVRHRGAIGSGVEGVSRLEISVFLVRAELAGYMAGEAVV